PKWRATGASFSARPTVATRRRGHSLQFLRGRTHPAFPRGSIMFQSLIELFPAEWRGALMVLTAPLRWIPEWQAIVLTSMSRQHPATIAIAAAALLLPVLLLIAGMWSTMVSLYTLPFRSGRGSFVTAF